MGTANLWKMNKDCGPTVYRKRMCSHLLAIINNEMKEQSKKQTPKNNSWLSGTSIHRMTVPGNGTLYLTMTGDHAGSQSIWYKTRVYFA